jgi:hypothetical protein
MAAAVGANARHLGRSEDAAAQHGAALHRWSLYLYVGQGLTEWAGNQESSAAMACPSARCRCLVSNMCLCQQQQQQMMMIAGLLL